MKTNLIRFSSLLLVLLLVGSTVGFLTFAEETDTAPGGTESTGEALQPEEIPNELLLDVDFRGGEDYALTMLKSTGGEAEPSEDGNSVVLRTVKTESRTAIHTLYWGGLLGLPLDGESYTVTFAVTNTGDYRFGVMLDYNGSDPAASTNIQGTPETILGDTAVTPDDLNGMRYYCVELDGEANTLNFYVLAGGEYQMISTTPFVSGAPVSEELALVFYLYGGRNTTAPQGTVLAEITVSDCNVYRGIYRGAMLQEQSPEADGSLLLEIPDLSKDAFNPETGIGYRQSVSNNDHFYEFDSVNGLMKTYATGTSTTYVYGGATNLKLGEGAKYTISYMTQLSISSGSGLRISYAANNNSIGTYIQRGQACLAWGTNTTNGYSGYKSYTAGMLQSGSIFWQEGDYAKVDIEINDTVVSVYINDVLLLSEDITAPSNETANANISKNFMSDTLNIVWHEYELADTAAGTTSTVFKDIKIYSGLLHQEVYDIEALTLQVGAAAGGTQAIRFVGGGLTGAYNRVGFEITAAYGDKTDRYEYSTPQTYLRLTPPRADEAIPELTAESASMAYLYGYTLSGVPTDISITFTVRPFAVKNGNRLYGETVTYVLENGILK